MVDFIGIDEETRRIAKGHRLTIEGEEWRGVRLVRVTVQRTPLPQDTEHIYLRATAAKAAGYAMINAAEGQPRDDTCEPWVRGQPLPGGDWLDRVRAALEAPRATSNGHKDTIGVARLLIEELDRMRAAKGGSHV